MVSHRKPRRVRPFEREVAITFGVRAIDSLAPFVSLGNGNAITYTKRRVPPGREAGRGKLGLRAYQ